MARARARAGVGAGLHDGAGNAATFRAPFRYSCHLYNYISVQIPSIALCHLIIITNNTSLLPTPRIRVYLL